MSYLLFIYVRLKPVLSTRIYTLHLNILNSRKKLWIHIFWQFNEENFLPKKYTYNFHKNIFFFHIILIFNIYNTYL